MQIVFALVALVVGFVLLVKGADWFVEGSAGIANKFGIPQIVIQCFFLFTLCSHFFHILCFKD